MIHPLLPNHLQKTQETMRMAAEFILRPISRKYDKAEHEPPLEMEQLNKAAAAQKKKKPEWAMILLSQWILEEEVFGL